MEKDKIDNNPIILLASERSGTNLIRHLLSNHSNIAGSVAAHLLEEFSSLRLYYGDLREKENCRILFNNMVALVNNEYIDWNLQFSFEEFYSKYQPTSLFGVVHDLYSHKATLEGKRRYISKELHLWNYAFEIKAQCPNTKFIYLVRDPRDVVTSWMKKPIFLLTPYDAVINWKKNQDEIHELINAGGIDVHTVKYEDLIADPKSIMAGILLFLGEKFELSCIETDHEKAKDTAWNDYWKNLSKPIINNNSGKYLDYLSAQDNEMIETICQSHMKKLGYSFTTECKWKPSISFYLRTYKQKKEARVRSENLSVEWNKKINSKFQLMRGIRAGLKNSPVDHRGGNSFFTRLENIIIKSAKFVEKRTKFFFYAIAGERFTNSVIKKIGF